MVAKGMSHTELYTKFVEATTQCRQEALAKRQIEITMELVSSHHPSLMFTANLCCKRN